MTLPEREQSNGIGLTGKIGGVPTWALLGGAIAIGIGALLWIQHRNSSASQSTGSTVNIPNTDTSDLQSQLSTVEAQIRDVQGGGSTTPAGGNSTAQVVEGLPLGQFLDQINKLYPGLQLDEAKFRQLNPTNTLAQANKYGYISTSNPASRDPGSLGWVFSSPAQVRIQ